MLRIIRALGKGAGAALDWLRVGGRWKIALLALSALLVALAVRGCVNAKVDSRVAQESAAAEHNSRVAGDRAITRSAADKARIIQKEAAGKARLETALEQNKEWASQPVPDAVLDSLHD